MKKISIIVILILQASVLFAQKEKSYIHKGNELYSAQKYKEAESNYRKSVEKKNQSVEGNFNLGDALYKQNKFADAGEQFSKIGASSSDKKVIAEAYHNLGNSLLKSKKLQESIEAYKKSLINNPKDDQTRYNLAYAQQLLKQQQQKKNQKNKNQNNKDQNNKDQQNKDQKKDGKNDQNKPDQNKNNQQNKGEQPDKISKEDAQRMLDALNNQEKNTQDKLKNKKLKGEKVRITKDW